MLVLLNESNSSSYGLHGLPRINLGPAALLGPGERIGPSPPRFSLSDRLRCGAADSRLHSTRARLSVSADQARNSISSGRCIRCRGPPVGRKVKPLLGSVVVENMGGGGSSIGAAAVA